MSGFISSAVSGKTTAPKATGRRRPLPVAKPVPQPTPITEPVEASPQQPDASSQPQHQVHDVNLLPTPQSTAQDITANTDGPESPNKRRRHSEQHESDGPSAKRVARPTRSKGPTIAAIEETDVSATDASRSIPSPPSTQMPAPQAVMLASNSNVSGEDLQDGAAHGLAVQSEEARSKRRGTREIATTRKTRLRAGQADPNNEDEVQNTAGEEGATAPVIVKRTRRKKGAKSTELVAESADPELHEIDPTTLSMFALSHDRKHGKVSEREKKMAEIDWDEVKRKRREAAERIAKGEPTAEDAAIAAGEAANDQDGAAVAENDTNETSGATEVPESSSQPVPSGGLRFRMVNGQIVEDEETLAVDRNAEAQAKALNSEPVEEDNDLTARVNRASWINQRRRDPADRVPMWKSKSDPWNDDDTDRFYDALRMFGTDFFIISKMFPPKTRRQIKAKFTREEKIDPTRINSALMGVESKPMDLEVYAAAAGRDVSAYTKYESYEHANEMIRESLKEKEEILEQALQEEIENARQQEIQKEQKRLAVEGRRNERANRHGGHRKKMGAGTLG